MKVSISVPGRFHAFALAKQLLDRGYLHYLVTSYPSFEVKKYGIPAQKVKTIVSKELIQRAFKKLTGKYPSGVFLNNWFDRIASVKLPCDSDIYIIWAGFASHTIKKLRKKNPKAIFIIERGSAHIETQNELLKIFDKDGEPINIGVIKKEKLEYRLADFISLPSSFAKKTFIEKDVPEGKLVVNYYGVDLDKFKLSNTSEIISHDVFTVGYVGNISNQKNVGGIINACEILVNKGYNLKLLLIGPIDALSFDEKEIREKKFINYLGTMPEDNLPTAYCQMDAFVLNSVQDGFGMVLLQAMAMCVVPIATNNTGGPDIIKEGINGFLIDILRDDKLSDKIEFLINHEEKRRSMGLEAKNTVKSGFTWDDYGNRAISFYKKILHENCRGDIFTS